MSLSFRLAILTLTLLVAQQLHADGEPQANASDGAAASETVANTKGVANGDSETVAETPTEPAEEGSRAVILPGTTVIGGLEEMYDLPGSGFYIDTPDIREQSYDDVNRILRKVPGVYLREEDGYGLFPNISLRGVDTTRSAKVTLMEDGILAAPAPYSAPSAYYSPQAGRMSGLEVLKGSSQVRYGPHTTGGVINYLSTPIPDDASGYIKFLYGSDNDMRVHANYGDIIETEKYGNFGYLVELYYRSTYGYKGVNSAPDLDGGDVDTGFRTVEPMVKLMWEPPSEQYQRLEFKYGYTDRDADETYLGLSEADFNEDPYQRYSTTRFDNIETYQHRYYLKHFIEVNENFDISTSAYYNKFHRNWYKLHDIRDIDTDGDGVPEGDEVGGSRVSASLSGALAGAESGAALEVLQGLRAGDLRIRANNRDYYMWGVQLEPNWRFETGELNHDLLFGVRYHADQIRRFQRNDEFDVASDGTVSDNDGDGSAFDPGTDGDAGNRRQRTRSLAFWIRDEITFDGLEKLTLTPGFRFEHLWQHQTDFDNPSRSGDTTMSLVGGGLGATYDLTEQWTLFAGAHRGYSPPSPRAALSGIEEETSNAFEGGFRYRRPEHAFSAEVTGFYTHFNDLIVIDNGAAGGAGGTGSGVTENVGEIDTLGLELFMQYDPGAAYNWGVSTPSYVSFTYTHAELDGEANSPDAESLFSGGADGNKVPYIPEYLVTFGTGLDFEKFGMFINASYVSSMYTSASNTEEQVNADGDPDSRFGKLDHHFVVDLTGYYKINDQAKIVGGVHNLFDEAYTASRHPHGPRPGKPRFLYIGMEVTF